MGYAIDLSSETAQCKPHLSSMKRNVSTAIIVELPLYHVVASVRGFHPCHSVSIEYLQPTCLSLMFQTLYKQKCRRSQ